MVIKSKKTLPGVSLWLKIRKIKDYGESKSQDRLINKNIVIEKY
jgi:hypothetical protein